jgi:hypothetical protein
MTIIPIELWEPAPQQEIDIPIKGYEGMYRISNFGTVVSLKSGVPKVLKQHITKGPDGGYCKVKLYNKNMEPKTLSVHRLVAQNFIQNWRLRPEVNHKNNTRNDNRVNNLEWCNRKENCEHAVKQNRYNPGKGENNKASILTNEQVLEIRSKSWSCYREVAEKYGISIATAWQILSGKTWKHLL